MDLDLDLTDEFGAASNGRHKCSMCYPTPTLGEGGGTGGGEREVKEVGEAMEPL